MAGEGPKKYSDTDNTAEFNSSRELQQAEDTLFDIRKEHEKQINKFKKDMFEAMKVLEHANLKDIYNTNVKNIRAIQNYREQLEEEYADKMTGNAAKDLENKKKMAMELAAFTENLNKQAVLSERDERKRTASDRLRTEIQYYKEIQKKDKNLTKEQRKANAKAHKEKLKDLKQEMKEAGASNREILEAQAEAGSKGAKAALQMQDSMADAAGKILNGLLNNWKNIFQGTIDSYATYQAKVNTRLQGSGLSWQGGGTGNWFVDQILGSGGGIEQRLTRNLALSPYVKLQQVMDNVVKATEAGIAFNIEQRAFLATISENIASTFDAFDSSLLRLIRIQQADSTAQRLGLEASLTKFFNANFGDTSYLSSTFDSVSQNLLEATSLMSAQGGVAFEYVVQKWLGSLASVGFSDSALSSIASAIGMLGSGNVSGLAGNEVMQNLLVMSAARAGLDYATLFNNLDAEKTNTLLESMVDYLQEIADSDNKIVKSQYAQIFGMTVSDLKAAKNLQGTLRDISSSMLSSGGAIDELYDQMSQLDERLSIGNRMKNVLENGVFSIGSNIAATPALYALWEVTSMIEDVAGGIALPTISVMGSSVDLNTTLTNLMRTGIVGAGTLGLIGDVVNAAAGGRNIFGASGLLESMGIGQGHVMTTRGAALNSAGGKNLRRLSQSGVVGNASSEDYYTNTLQQADLAKEDLQLKNQEDVAISLNDIHRYLLEVFDPKITDIDRMLAVISGAKASVSDYGKIFGKPTSSYGATKVSVELPQEAAQADVDDSQASTAAIGKNVASILNILERVTSGDHLMVSVSGLGLGVNG